MCVREKVRRKSMCVRVWRYETEERQRKYNEWERMRKMDFVRKTGRPKFSGITSLLQKVF